VSRCNPFIKESDALTEKADRKKGKTDPLLTIAVTRASGQVKKKGVWLMSNRLDQRRQEKDFLVVKDWLVMTPGKGVRAESGGALQKVLRHGLDLSLKSD